jgi:hypothetical protein
MAVVPDDVPAAPRVGHFAPVAELVYVTWLAVQGPLRA